METKKTKSNTMKHDTNKTIRISPDEIKAVQCHICGTLHEVKENNDLNYGFITIMGNMMIGDQGGIIGNNIIEKETSDGNVIDYVKRTFICNTDECWNKLRKKFVRKLSRSGGGIYK